MIFTLKKILAQGLDSSVSLDRYFLKRRDRYILCYHRVLTAQQAESYGVHHSLWISPNNLVSQIRWMQSVGEIVDYTRIMDYTRSNDRPLFSLTFDDGWKDNYTNALSILKEFKIPAHIFLSTAAIDNDALFWPQDIATKTKHILNSDQSDRVLKVLLDYLPDHLQTFKVSQSNAMELIENWIENLKLMNDVDRRQLIDGYFRHLNLSTMPLTGFIMNWDEVREMQKQGISFGSHTHHHTILKGLPSTQIEYELRLSKNIIEDKLQMTVNSFCYPNGRYNLQEGAILSLSGYIYGFTLDNMSLRHCLDNFYIPRYLLSERNSANPAYFKLRLLQVPLFQTKPHDPHREET